MSFAVGSLVHTRGREWVVLPNSDAKTLLLRPLGGTDIEVTGLYLPLEGHDVRPAAFALPDPTNPNDFGDHRSCRLLRDAVRLGFRSSGGPFRSFAKINVEPRPYQLVPLLLALKQDPVRLLIADDVGIGKTVEAALIVRELLDRGEVTRFAVLCPPHLTEQWQRELREKFHLDPVLVLSSTAAQLERQCRQAETVFDVFPHTVVSTDFIKSHRRRDDFLRSCPELVVVDEAHTCAVAEGRGGKQQRHELVRDLAQKPLADGTLRHLVLVTATPHSGKEEAFRSLLSLVNPEFANLPADLSGEKNRRQRQRLAEYVVQRRRGDIRHFMKEETPFPDREEREDTYQLTPAYRGLFREVLAYAQETVRDESGGRHRQRVRWWSALALLRALASSPAAAAATLKNRAATADTTSDREADEVGRRAVMDLLDDEATDAQDVTPGADPGDEDGEQDAPAHNRLATLAQQAEALAGREDRKLQRVAELTQGLLDDGYHPILFCRFIDTAEYVADQLRQKLGKKVEVVAVTGQQPPAEREERILALAESPKRILVCTDCLSEGINLQQHFNAVVHYDLAWSPTRHEQREGRVDRYGQPSPSVRVLTFYGVDNQIDGIVLDVLIRKHRNIRSSLGISVPVPVESDKLMQAILEGLLLRGKPSPKQQQMLLFDPNEDKVVREVHGDWDRSAEQERRSRTVFAQETMTAQIDEVERELRAVREAIGSGVDTRRFVIEATQAHKGLVAERPGDRWRLDFKECPMPLRDLLALGEKNQTVEARFSLPVDEGTLYLTRTHPLVDKLATFVMDTALDPTAPGQARRCGVIRTAAVERRRTLLLVRFRFQIVTQRRDGQEQHLLAEECRVLGYSGSPEKAEWIEDQAALEQLLAAVPEANVNPDMARDQIQKVVDNHDEHLLPHLQDVARRLGNQLEEAHRRVRRTMQARGITHRVEPKLPPDVLGIYLLFPLV